MGRAGQGAPLVLYDVDSERSTFQCDAETMADGDQDLVAGRWRPEPWSEHAERVAFPDGPRLVALWDDGQVELLQAGEHPYGRPPGPALRYLEQG